MDAILAIAKDLNCNPTGSWVLVASQTSLSLELHIWGSQYLPTFQLFKEKCSSGVLSTPVLKREKALAEVLLVLHIYGF